MKIKLTARLMLTEERYEAELPDDAGVGELLEQLRTRHPELGEMKNILISRNGKRSSRNEALSDGDQLELILLMGGG